MGVGVRSGSSESSTGYGRPGLPFAKSPAASSFCGSLSSSRLRPEGAAEDATSERAAPRTPGRAAPPRPPAEVGPRSPATRSFPRWSERRSPPGKDTPPPPAPRGGGGGGGGGSPCRPRRRAARCDPTWWWDAAAWTGGPGRAAGWRRRRRVGGCGSARGSAAGPFFLGRGSARFLGTAPRGSGARRFRVAVLRRSRCQARLGPRAGVSAAEGTLGAGG